MKKTTLINVILILAVVVFPACGKNGGDEPDANAPATVVVTASKALALANGSDAVTMQAEVKKADGTAVADGTSVAFSVPAGAGTLSASSASTANGLASVTLVCAQISGAKNYSMNVAASAGSVSGDSPGVKFINQPSSAEITVALMQPVTNLGALQFTLNNSAGAAFNDTAQPVAALNSAVGSLPAGKFSPAANSTTFALISAAGFNSGTAPIIKATFTVAADAGLPAFSVDPAASLIAMDPAGVAATPALTADNMLVAVTFDTEL